MEGLFAPIYTQLPYPSDPHIGQYSLLRPAIVIGCYSCERECVLSTGVDTGSWERFTGDVVVGEWVRYTTLPQDTGGFESHLKTKSGVYNYQTYLIYYFQFAAAVWLVLGN